MIRHIDDRTELIFGTGDIGFNPGVIDDKEPELINIEYPFTSTCDKCGKTVRQDQIVYKGICWNCFKSKVISIAREVKTLDSAEMILHMLNITERRYYNMR